MAQIDIFNGDADGICALTQLRNAQPSQSTLITGVKRDIALVAKAKVTSGDRITALDISFDKNRDGVIEALEAGAEIFYVDHHFAGEVPEHDRLTTIIDTDANVCTSLLVNGYLQGKYVEWAVTGAFGDNLKASAHTIAAPLALSEDELTLLENLGIYMNYIGYGSSLEDLHFAPAELFELVRPFATPFAFIEEAREAFEKLEAGYRQDMAAAAALKPHRESDKTAVSSCPTRPGRAACRASTATIWPTHPLREPTPCSPSEPMGRTSSAFERHSRTNRVRTRSAGSSRPAVVVEQRRASTRCRPINYTRSWTHSRFRTLSSVLHGVQCRTTGLRARG